MKDDEYYLQQEHDERHRRLGLMADVLAMLERLKWIRHDPPGHGWPFCAICGNFKVHRSDCELDALVKRAREEMGK
jgi:hypothetical protein